MLGLNAWHPQCVGDSAIPASPEPVFFLGFNLAERDQRLFHHYMLSMPEIKYGIDPTGPFNLHRDDGFAMTRLHRVVLHWLLVASEQHLSQHSPGPVPTTVLRRRAIAYRITNETLAQFGSDSTINEDGVVAAVTAAVVMDTRGSTMDARMVHMRGLDTLLRAQGGYHFLEGKPNLHRFVIWAHMLCNGGIVQNHSELRNLQQTCIKTFRSLNAWNRELGARITLICSGQGSSQLPGELQQYVRARLRLFGPYSHLRLLLAPSSEATSNLEKSCVLCCLLLLNLVLFEHKDNLSDACGYLNRLSDAIEASTLTDGRDGSWLITIRGLIGLLYQGGFESDSSEENNREFWRSWQVIDIVKIISRTSERTWEEVTGIMCGWLLGFCDDDAGSWPVLTERECLTIERESTRVWKEESEVGGSRASL